MRFYRTWVLVSAAAWFLVGLHAPAIHQVTHHGRDLPATVFAAIAVLVLVGSAGLWRLLRASEALRPASGART
jgi:uncharacterized membrane protein (DUF2068 family)